MSKIIIDDKALRIMPFFSEQGVVHIPTSDFTLIGLVSKPSAYGVGGVKVKHEYCDSEDNVVVAKQFSYDEKGVTIVFEWFNNDDTVGSKKTEFKPLSPVQVANLKKKNRDRTLMYLKATAVGTPIADVVSEILLHYKHEIELWLLNGTSEWATAIVGEQSQPIATYLAIQTEIPTEAYPNGITVADGIMYQITAA
jgi:hypothetical protein